MRLEIPRAEKSREPGVPLGGEHLGQIMKIWLFGEHIPPQIYLVVTGEQFG